MENEINTIDFTKMSKQEIIDCCSKSNEYKSKFAEFFCGLVTNDITKFFTEHIDDKQAFIHVFSAEDSDEFKYVIDLKEDSYPDTLCIKLTIEQASPVEAVIEDENDIDKNVDKDVIDIDTDIDKKI